MKKSPAIHIALPFTGLATLALTFLFAAPSVAANQPLESHLEGIVCVAIEDHFTPDKNGRMTGYAIARYTVKVGQFEFVDLEGEADVLDKLQSGERIVLQGQRETSNRFTVSRIISREPGPDMTAAKAFLGEQHLAVVPVRFPNLDLTSQCSWAVIDIIAFTSQKSLTKYWEETSFGKLTFSDQSKTFEVVTLPDDYVGGCNLELWAAQADASIGGEIDAYNRRVYVFPPSLTACPSGLGNIGNEGLAVTRSWVRACNTPDLYIHELGHNFGLLHAWTTTGEYGDTSDVMGFSGLGVRKLNGPHVDFLDWLPDGEPHFRTLSGVGTYDETLTALGRDYETEPNATQVLKVFAPSLGRDLYITYRDHHGMDASLHPNYGHKTHVHISRGGNNGRESTLLQVLSSNQSYLLDLDGITISQIGTDLTSGTAQVRVVLGEPCAVECSTDEDCDPPSCTEGKHFVSTCQSAGTCDSGCQVAWVPDDPDGDGVDTPCGDNCPESPNPDQVDADGDAYGAACDCDDSDPSVHPGAPELSDCRNNDCDDPFWPQLPDPDGDGFPRCLGDCNEAQASVNPGALESCNGYDDDCDGELDEGCDRTCDNPEMTGEHVLVSDSGPLRPAALTAAGAGYGVAWSQSAFQAPEQTTFARLDNVGSLVGNPVFVGASVKETPALVWTGSEYGLAFRRNLGFEPQISFMRLDAAGDPLGNLVEVTFDAVTSSAPALTWNGYEYALAWSVSDGGGYVKFARLGATGVTISVSTISGTGAPVRQPSMAWTGDGYAVAWSDDRSGNAEIWFRLIDEFGLPAGPEIRISDDPQASNWPVLAWSGADLALAWDGFFTILDASGDRRIADVALPAGRPALAWSGDEYVVAAGGELLRFDVLGNLQGRTDIRPGDVALAWNGLGYFMVTERLENGVYALLSGTVECNCKDADGDGSSCGDCNDADPAVYPGAPQICDGLNNDCLHPHYPLLIDVPESDDDLDGVSECDGDCDDYNHLAVPNLPETCDGLDNDCNGHVDDAEDCDATCDSPEAVTGGVTVPGTVRDVIWGGDLYGVLYEDAYYDSRLAITVLRHPAGALLADNLELDGAGGSHDFHPAAASYGDRFLVAWVDGQGYLRSDLLREPADAGDPLLLGNQLDTVADIGVVWNGDGWGVLSAGSTFGMYEQTMGSIWLSRLDHDGNEVGADKRLVNLPHQAIRSIDVVWDGDQYAVVWSDDRHGTDEIFFARFDASGNPVGTELRVTDDSANSRNPSIAWTGEFYGIGWDETSGFLGDPRLAFVRVDADGVPDGAPRPLMDEFDVAAAPDLVWTGAEFGVAWDTGFARLDEPGTELSDRIGLALTSTPSVAWTGTGFLLGTAHNTLGRIGCECLDGDGDLFSSCNDCNDADAAIHPGAPALCDGRNNDCNDPFWPQLTDLDEIDLDGDGFPRCLGDCNEALASVNPGALEICNGYDDDCDGELDEGCDRTCDSRGQIGSSTSVVLTGGESTIEVMFDFGTSGIVGSYGATLGFDPDILTLVGLEGGDPPFDNPVVNADGPAGFVQFADAALGAPTGRIVVLRVTFTTLALPPVTTDIDLEVTSAFEDGSFEDMLPCLETHDSVACVADWSFDLQLSDPAATLLDWNPVAGAVAYDVIRGVLGELSDDGFVVRLEAVECREGASLDTTTGAGTEAANPDEDVPAPGQGFYYLVRPVFADVVGTYGFVAACDRERTVLLGDCVQSRRRQANR